jgi:hypothetical protein
MRVTAATSGRQRLSRVIAAVGFVAFPYCVALGVWTPGQPERDDLRRLRSWPLFWLASLVPWNGAAAASPVIGIRAAAAAVYAGAVAMVVVRLQRRRVSKARRASTAAPRGLH